MTRKYLVYVTSVRATLYESRRGALAALESFSNDEEGYAGFVQALRGLAGGLAYILADLVEEDFHVDLVPAVGGKDRAQLLARRIAQRYRDTSLSLAISLGFERTQRRDERILLSSFTNTQLVTPWVNVLAQSTLALVGVYSVALMAPSLARRLKGGKAPCLLVSLQPAGLRQTLVTAGRVRFSRLGPLDPADADQPTRLAAAFATETVRIHQYLTSVRVLPREDPAVDVALIAPAGRGALLQAAASDTPQLRYRVIDVAQAAAAIGLRHLPQGGGAECLYLHLLASTAPREQYLGARLRRNFTIWRTRVALVAGGTMIGLACLAVACLQWWNTEEIREQTTSEQSRVRTLGEEYSRYTQTFPKIPTSSENLKATVQQYGTLLKQIRSPDAMLADLGSVLAQSPQVEIESLKWEQSAAPRGPGRTPETAAAGAAVVPGGASTAGDGRYEMIELAARVVGIAANDYRGVSDAVNEFVDRLRAQARIEILARKLPFDIGSETSLTGDIGVERPAEAPVFQLTIGRRQTP